MMPVTAILGAGPGNGLAFARRFSKEGHALALCSRNAAQMAAYATGFPDAKGYAYDVADGDAGRATFAAIQSDLGPVETVIYNAGSGAWGNVDELQPADLTKNMDINATGLMRAAQAVLPQFRAQGGGNLIVIGAGAALRGRAGTLAFAAGKAAQRSVAQSLARHLGPEKIHVAYVIIDGGINTPGMLERRPNLTADDLLDPDGIAQAVWNLTQQPRTAWTFELDLRPFGETW